MLRRIKDKNPEAIVIACGCYVQVAEKEIESILDVDIVIGTNQKKDIVDIINNYIINKKKTANVSDVMKECEYQDFGTITFTEQTRAVVKVQDGCDRFCSYCIIPYARGRVRSRKPESILQEVQQIAKKGLQEVVLTGIHIASYGKDFNKEETESYRKQYGYSEEYTEFTPMDDLHSGGFRLIELIEQINKIEGIKRIRIGSIEPKLVNSEWVERISKLEKVCHHFHLSLQSGCDETLVRMNRRYTTSEFQESVNLLRKYYNDVMLTTDVIVGFPGETDEEFEKTYKFLENIRFYKMHIFKYSPKPGTKAKEMKEQIDGKIKEQRSKKLIELSDEIQKEYEKSYEGKNVEVLFEEKDGEYYKGHTSNYMMVKVKSEKDLTNKIKNVSFFTNCWLLPYIIIK